MVRMTTWLCRVPVIKFRKGGAAGRQSVPPGISAPSPVASAAPTASTVPPPRPVVQAQPVASMSTRPTIPDIELPARYRRTPLSDEEIDHINGGGIKDSGSRNSVSTALGIIKLPKGILIQSGKRKEAITLNIVLQKSNK